MKKRTNGFLEHLYPDGVAPTEVGEYVNELHNYLWRFVRVEFPFSNGDLAKYLDVAIESAEYRGKLNPPKD